MTPRTMLNLTKRLRTSRNKSWRLVVLVPLVVSAALIHMTAPAGAANGAGVVSGFVNRNNPTTFACTPGAGYTFTDLEIGGLTVSTTVQHVGTTGFTDLPTGGATGDPLDGTPLGCRPGDLAPTLTGGGNPIIPIGTPLLGCPPANVPCNGGPGTSNVLSEEGTVVGRDGDGNFDCDGRGTLVSLNVPGTNFLACSLHGSYVRYGSTMLMSLTGCMKVLAGYDPGTCSASPATDDVALVAQVVPVPLNFCNALSTGFECSVLAGTYVDSQHGSVTGSGGVVQALLDTLYCPLGAGHIPGVYPPDPHCN